MAKKRGLAKASEIRERLEKRSKKPIPSEARVNETIQLFSVLKTLNTHNAEVIGSNIRIPLSTGIVKSLREIGERLDRITGQKRKRNKPRKSAEIDIWTITKTPNGSTHLFMELKNLPKNENVSTISRYYRYVTELSKLLKRHTYLLGMADTRSMPLAALGKKIKIPVESWSKANKMVYVLVTNRKPTEKEWKRIEEIREKTGHNVLLVRDYEIGKLLNHLKEGKTNGEFAGKSQKILLYNCASEGPLDKFLKSKKKKD